MDEKDPAIIFPTGVVLLPANWREDVDMMDDSTVELILSGNQARLLLNALDVYDPAKDLHSAELLFQLISQTLRARLIVVNRGRKND